MVTALPIFRPTSRDKVKHIQSHFYGATSPKPVMKKVHTQTNASGCSPRLDLLMSQHRLQPRTHDTVVSVVYKGREYHFHIFVKYHPWLQKNNVVRVLKARSWRGDILVMKKGRSELVNMSSGYAHLADYAVRRFVGRVPQCTPFDVPANLRFHKRR